MKHPGTREPPPLPPSAAARGRTDTTDRASGRLRWSATELYDALLRAAELLRAHGESEGARVLMRLAARIHAPAWLSCCLGEVELACGDAAAARSCFIASLRCADWRPFRKRAEAGLRRAVAALERRPTLVATPLVTADRSPR